MLSVAVLTTAGAFERQLPEPLSHFFPFGVWVPEAVGVDALFELAVESAKDLLGALFGRRSLPLGVVEVVFALLASGGTCAPVLSPSAGAWGFGLDFLRGFIRAGRVKELSRRKGR
jgi:hypothetical protein